MQQTASTLPSSREMGRDTQGLLASMRARILSGKLAAGTFLPTVRELSRQQGVAHGTAWRALKALESEGLVEARSRRGYRVLAPEDRESPAGTVAYVMDQRNISAGSWERIYSQLLEKLESCATRGGSRLLKLIMNPGQEELVAEQLAASKVRGLVVDGLSDPLLDWARSSGVPAVVVDDWRAGLAADCVVQDGFAGGMLAAKQLITAGCRRIAWFGRTLNNYHGKSRFGGASAELSGAGLSFAQQLCLPIDSASRAELARNAAQLVADRSVDGILALWGPMLQAVLEAAPRAGREIGRDLHVVGWSVRELLAVEAGPAAAHPFSMVSWSAADMARVALSRLSARLADPTLPASCTTISVGIYSQDGQAATEV